MHTMKMHGYATPNYNEQLVKTINHCKVTCDKMIPYLLQLRDVHTRTTQIRLLMDCADICDLASRMLSQNSYVSKEVISLCAYICELCGRECAKFQDTMSQHCSQTCLNCARDCQAYVMA